MVPSTALLHCTLLTYLSHTLSWPAPMHIQVKAVQIRWGRVQAEQAEEARKAAAEAATLRAKRRKARQDAKAAAAAAAAAGGESSAEGLDAGTLGATLGGTLGSTQLGRSIEGGDDLAGDTDGGEGADVAPAGPQGPVLPVYGGLMGVLVHDAGARCIKVRELYRMLGGAAQNVVRCCAGCCCGVAGDGGGVEGRGSQVTTHRTPQGSHCCYLSSRGKFCATRR